MNRVVLFENRDLSRPDNTVGGRDRVSSLKQAWQIPKTETAAADFLFAKRSRRAAGSECWAANPPETLDLLYRQHVTADCEIASEQTIPSAQCGPVNAGTTSRSKPDLRRERNAEKNATMIVGFSVLPRG